jgi:hypothetical protein
MKLITSQCESRPNYLLFMEILSQDLILFGWVFFVLNQRLVILVDARKEGSPLAVRSSLAPSRHIRQKSWLGEYAALASFPH